MTDPELDVMQSRADAASEGPWRPEVTPWGFAVVRRHLGGDLCCVEPDDAAFVAHARQDVPALVAEVRRLNQQIATLTGPPTVEEIYRSERGLLG